MDVLRHCEREIVRALKTTGSTQSQVTHADRFEIATDDVVVKVWTVDAYERERGAVEALEKIERLKDRWSAPLEHPVGDMSDPAYAGAAAWAAVGSEAHKIAHDFLKGRSGS
jgi:hypothetical protein